jgi:hypothetical protein
MSVITRLAAGAAIVVGAAAAGSYAYSRHRDRDRGEGPVYALIRGEADFELRDYAPMIIAEITSKGDRREASERSFRRLAAYIFAKDRPEGGEKIAMTSPVLQQQTGAQTWQMRFVMPRQYTLDTLPAAPDEIALSQVPARRMAAVRFSGNASPDELDEMEGRLTAWIANQALSPLGDFEYAFYDAPMVPGPLRRNEVLVEVAER